MEFAKYENHYTKINNISMHHQNQLDYVPLEAHYI